MKRFLLAPLLLFLLVGCSSKEKVEIQKDTWIPLEELTDEISKFSGKYQYKFLGCIGDICQYKMALRWSKSADWAGHSTIKVYCDTLEQQRIKWIHYEMPSDSNDELKKKEALDFSLPIHKFALKICEQR